MQTKLRLLGEAIALVLLAVSPALAGYPYTVDSSVSVCDPQSPAACIRPATSGGAFPVSPTGGASTDISGTVTLGGTYQSVAAASSSRKNCTIQNPTTATEALSVKFGTMATAYSLSPGGAISALNGTVVATDAITVTAATTSHAFAGTCQ